ncbi:MAG: hypothetical protein IT445_18345, partial [Phycisphaeraceae bacterium]|nr:hypothetical protein [Phycisphaeraceae bacterium]
MQVTFKHKCSTGEATMFEYHAQLEARTALFNHHLNLMVPRRAVERRSDCALIFSEPSQDDSSAVHLATAKARPRQLANVERALGIAHPDRSSEGFIIRRADRDDDADTTGSPSDSTERYVQFAF